VCCFAPSFAHPGSGLGRFVLPGTVPELDVELPVPFGSQMGADTEPRFADPLPFDVADRATVERFCGGGVVAPPQRRARLRGQLGRLVMIFGGDCEPMPNLGWRGKKKKKKKKKKKRHGFGALGGGREG
jgi:hypothetical protein